jgi:pimeloyl-ACP methyl ester carboxylesterase
MTPRRDATVGLATAGERTTTVTEQLYAGEQSRARYPDETGYVERNGVRVFWESYGAGEQTVLFMPTWALVHSRVWKAQIPYFARHFRVITFDPRGNGRSDRPNELSAYDEREYMQDALDVMEACGVERAIAASFSTGAQRSMLLATEHPQRIEGLVFIGPLFPVSHASLRMRAMAHPLLRPFVLKPPITTRGWGKFNPHYWMNGGYSDFVQWWAQKMLTEPHSTKPIEDAIAWSHDTDGETIALTVQNQFAAPATRKAQTALAERIKCPVLVIHGTEDEVTPYADGKALARVTGGRLETVEGAGHMPHARKPVQVNLALREFVEGVPRHRDPTVHRSDGRKRALYISRRSASGTPSETRRSLASCETSSTALRSTGSPKTPSPGCSPRRVSGSIPRASTSPTSRGTSSRSPLSMTSTASRRSAAWTRS